MSSIVTLVASSPDKPVTTRHVRDIMEIMDHYNILPTCEPIWLMEDKAVDLGVSGQPNGALVLHLRDFLAQIETDLFITNPDRRRKKLLLADMDSTIVEGETLDELAAFAGLKDKIAAITAAAMEGKLDFQSALRERVGLLKDLPVSALVETLKRTRLNPGAERLVATMKKAGAKCVLVSGGFTFFTQEAALQSGFDFSHGNMLQIENEKLTGKVIEPILDKFAKVDFLKKYTRDLKLRPEDSMAIGDGANDIPMLKAAGLGVGYKPKSVVLNAIDNCIIYGDLTTALYAQGYTDLA